MYVREYQIAGRGVTRSVDVHPQQFVGARLTNLWMHQSRPLIVKSASSG
jgi:hypothetical protein